MTHVKGRRVYLSGPMTGLPDLNRKAFNDAEELVKSLDADYWYNPAQMIDRWKDDKYTFCLMRSIAEVCEFGYWDSDYEHPLYDLLVSLPGWEKSAGARLEREVAVACGIDVCELAEVVA